MVANAELDTTTTNKSSYAEMPKAGSRALGMSGLKALDERCLIVPFNEYKREPLAAIAMPRIKNVDVQEQHSSLEGGVKMPRRVASQLRVSSPLLRSESDFNPSSRRNARDRNLERRTLRGSAIDTVRWANRSDFRSESKEDNLAVTLKTLGIEENVTAPERLKDPDTGQLLRGQHGVTMSIISSRLDPSVPQSMSKRWEIIFTVPADARCGDQICCDVPNGSIATAIVPPNHVPGDKFISIFPPLPGKTITMLQSNKYETDKCFKCEQYRVTTHLTACLR